MKLNLPSSKRIFGHRLSLWLALLETLCSFFKLYFLQFYSKTSLLEKSISFTEIYLISLLIPDTFSFFYFFKPKVIENIYIFQIYEWNTSRDTSASIRWNYWNKIENKTTDMKLKEPKTKQNVFVGFSFFSFEAQSYRFTELVRCFCGSEVSVSSCDATLQRFQIFRKKQEAQV